jgi:hypothetical protein
MAGGEAVEDVVPRPAGTTHPVDQQKRFAGAGGGVGDDAVPDADSSLVTKGGL